MQTDFICAYQLEEGDYVLGDDESQSQVIELVGDHDLMEFYVRDLDTEEVDLVRYAPFDVVKIITSFEED